MTDDTTRSRRTPVHFVQKYNPIVVDDKVKARYVKTSEYWITEVVAIEGDDMTVQSFGDVGPIEHTKVPVGYVRVIGADGDYDDDYSALGGVSSRKTVDKKGNGQWDKPQRSSPGLCSHDVTKSGFIEEDPKGQFIEEDPKGPHSSRYPTSFSVHQTLLVWKTCLRQT